MDNFVMHYYHDGVGDLHSSGISDSRKIRSQRGEPIIPEPSPSRQELERAFTEAARMATRSSLMGMLGFGLALATGALLARQGSLLADGFGLDRVLFVGGLSGGVVFSFVALRASRIAKDCKRRLDEHPGRRR